MVHNFFILIKTLVLLWFLSYCDFSPLLFHFLGKSIIIFLENVPLLIDVTSAVHKHSSRTPKGMGNLTGLVFLGFRSIKETQEQKCVDKAQVKV